MSPAVLCARGEMGMLSEYCASHSEINSTDPAPTAQAPLTRRIALWDSATGLWVQKRVITRNKSFDHGSPSQSPELGRCGI